MKTHALILAAVALTFTAPAAAQQITNNSGTYGDTQAVSGGYRLTSDTSGSYSGIYFTFGGSGLQVNDLTSLSADYTLEEGSFAGGAPRFTLFDTTGNAANAAYIYFTGPPASTTGNYASLLDATVRVECNGFLGCTTTYPGTTFADFVSQAGSTGIRYITLDVDGGFTGNQSLLVTSFSVNGNEYGATGAVPEPTTWAMMLLGFGGIGAAMRRRRQPAKLAQLA